MLQDNFSELEKTRLEKIMRMRARGIEPYPTRAQRTATTSEAIRAYETAEASGSTEPVICTLAGRLRSIRNMGKLIFAHIEDAEGKVQLLFRLDELGPEKMAYFKDDFDLGDFVQASGSMFRTKRGEVTLLVEDFAMLAKALYQLPPDKDEVVDGKVVRHALLSDPETRFRQRYVDLAVNPEMRETFRLRTETVRALRKYLDERGLL